ncbi:MAG: YoaP domain-containing protein [Clostridiales bacterium]|nr:MAG: YoaP domain-containing protein [Clostridiales bacterium]
MCRLRLQKSTISPFKTVHIETKEQAQNAPSPITTYALFLQRRVSHKRGF